MNTNPQPEAANVEFLRDGHVVSKCGVPLLEYLLYYAQQRGLALGKPTTAGKKQHGKHVSLLINGGGAAMPRLISGRCQGAEKLTAAECAQVSGIVRQPGGPASPAERRAH
jgi:hypothetical protein